MAADERRSRFRCLTVARIAAASVVALAFAATMVAVVITAGFGPDKVHLSVTHGHIQSAAGPLWSRLDLPILHLRKGYNESITIYTPAKDLTVWLSMDARDPTRRAANVCIAAVNVLDMPLAPSFDGMVDIANITNTVTTGSGDKPCARWRRPGSATMQLDRWVTVSDDPVMRCYISQKYGGVNDFTVMLKVNMTIIYPEEDDTWAIYYCWPVTIGNTRLVRSKAAVTCKPSQAIDYAANAHVLSACDLTRRQQQICNYFGKLELPECSNSATSTEI